MPTLEIELNCMCLLVPEPQSGSEDRGTMHVLMPCTHHGSMNDRHVVSMLYRDVNGAVREAHLEGWELVLGAEDPSARVTLDPADPGSSGVIVDLTAVTMDEENPDGRRVPYDLLRGSHHDVISRIRFNEGEVQRIDAQDNARWELNGVGYVMAHRVTWRARAPEGKLDWRPLGHHAGTAEPLASLDGVLREGSDEDPVFKLEVHHVSEKARIPGNEVEFDPNVLEPPEIRHHFRMFYPLVGLTDVPDELLPELDPESVDTPAPIGDDPPGGGYGWACKLAVARPGPGTRPGGGPPPDSF